MGTTAEKPMKNSELCAQDHNDRMDGKISVRKRLLSAFI